jgi:hypothetical protein
MGLETSEEICEALVRHVEVSGSECFEKNFTDGRGRTLCTVWCVVGKENAGPFAEMARDWLNTNGFKLD